MTLINRYEDDVRIVADRTCTVERRVNIVVKFTTQDASHLLPGMKRVGYDADTERFTFREGDDLWLGEPGSFYGGKLRWAGKVQEAEEIEEDAYRSSRGHTDYRDHTETTVKPPRKIAGESTQNINELPRKVDDDWGVPVFSISDTGAQPPDSPEEDNSIQMRMTKAKRAATFKAHALGIFNRHLGKDTPHTTFSFEYSSGTEVGQKKTSKYNWFE